jgi:hypothetical protein
MCQRPRLWWRCAGVPRAPCPDLDEEDSSASTRAPSAKMAAARTATMTCLMVCPEISPMRFRHRAARVSILSNPSAEYDCLRRCYQMPRAEGWAKFSNRDARAHVERGRLPAVHVAPAVRDRRLDVGGVVARLGPLSKAVGGRAHAPGRLSQVLAEREPVLRGHGASAPSRFLQRSVLRCRLPPIRAFLRPIRVGIVGRDFVARSPIRARRDSSTAVHIATKTH